MEFKRGEYIEIRWDEHLNQDGYVLFVAKIHQSGYTFKVIHKPERWDISQQHGDMLFVTKTDWKKLRKVNQISKIDKEMIKVLYN